MAVAILKRPWGAGVSHHLTSKYPGGGDTAPGPRWALPMTHFACVKNGGLATPEGGCGIRKLDTVSVSLQYVAEFAGKKPQAGVPSSLGNVEKEARLRGPPGWTKRGTLGPVVEPDLRTPKGGLRAVASSAVDDYEVALLNPEDFGKDRNPHQRLRLEHVVIPLPGFISE